MAFEVPDPSTDFGARVAQRLAEETTAWLTSVDRAGAPQPAPVWFLWDADAATALIYNQPSAKRIVRLQSNPRASLSFNDKRGADFLVLTGTLVPAADAPPAAQNAPYLAKYGSVIAAMFGDADRFSSMFEVALRFEPRTVRGR
jgi:PPOX class probable F420-dependent enzyme